MTDERRFKSDDETYVDWERELLQPECIVCEEKLSNTTMAPANLKLSTKHSRLTGKSTGYFEILLDS